MHPKADLKDNDAEVSSTGGMPAWLEPWLSIPFYKGERCKKHVHQYNTIFCAVCMGSPVCETCWKRQHSRLHHGHISLQVCSASRRAAIEIKKFKKHMDASDIQVYKINGKDIFYLKPCREGVHENHNTHDPKCQTCAKKLKDSNCLFCSIACKHGNSGSGAAASAYAEEEEEEYYSRYRRMLLIGQVHHEHAQEESERNPFKSPILVNFVAKERPIK
ncbi:hypothetical protein Sango_0048900 [Sesamum angolense]|uniref:B box-type domain-containing protein n=1 Tax=Sesamum angolense TaxID=2727404 RepID=A0AAE2C5H1_9LAMI|nr:hypothetical protein Sango_0048900 [Sesamum angolense]